MLGDDEIFSVPKVFHSLTGKRVLTTELVYGVPLDHLTNADDSTRNWVRHSNASIGGYRSGINKVVVIY